MHAHIVSETFIHNNMMSSFFEFFNYWGFKNMKKHFNLNLTVLNRNYKNLQAFKIRSKKINFLPIKTA